MKRTGAVVLVAAFAVMAVAHASAETPLERGAYLMKGIVACGNCHTAPGGPFADKELSGGLTFDEPAFTTYAKNITPDKETGIGGWSDREIVLAIREGKRPKGGRIIGPPMPIVLYRNISDNDVKAIVAYLRQVKPVKRKMPEPVYRIPLPPAYGPPIKSVADVPRSDRIAYGKYLVQVGHCMECHTPLDKRGHMVMAKFGAGGNKFPGPWGESVSANLTPDKETGLGDWTDAQIKRAITAGVDKNDVKLRPPMAFAYYKNIKADDLNAIVAYLRTLKPIRNEVR